jgi:hypothetical protein
MFGSWNGYGKNEYGNLLETDFEREGLYEDGSFKIKPEFVIEEFDPKTDWIA